jgi:hypothetical protein
VLLSTYWFSNFLAELELRLMAAILFLRVFLPLLLKMLFLFELLTLNLLIYLAFLSE